MLIMFSILCFLRVCYPHGPFSRQAAFACKSKSKLLPYHTSLHPLTVTMKGQTVSRGLFRIMPQILQEMLSREDCNTMNAGHFGPGVSLNYLFLALLRDWQWCLSSPRVATMFMVLLSQKTANPQVVFFKVNNSTTLWCPYFPHSVVVRTLMDILKNRLSSAACSRSVTEKRIQLQKSEFNCCQPSTHANSIEGESECQIRWTIDKEQFLLCQEH